MECSASYDHSHVINDSFYRENITLGLQNQSTYTYGDAYCFAMELLVVGQVSVYC